MKKYTYVILEHPKSGKSTVVGSLVGQSWRTREEAEGYVECVRELCDGIVQPLNTNDLEIVKIELPTTSDEE